MNTLSSGSEGLENISAVTQDDFVRLPKLQMFKKQGLFPTMLRASANVRGIILPAFDDSLSKHDTSYGISHMPYRDEAKPRQKNGLHPFSGWFVPIGGRPENSKFSVGGVYRYFGRSKSTFISPTSVGMPDPIVDLAIWIRVQNKKYNNSQYMYLLKKAPYDKNNPTSTPPTPLPYPTPAVLMNAVCTGSNPHDENKDSMENRVVLMTEMTFKALQKDLASYTPADMAPVDAKWPKMLYGDITAPEGALMFNVKEDNESNITFARMHFGEAVMTQNGTFAFNGQKMAITQEMLAGRYDLTDTQNVVNIPTYDDIVMQLLVEGLVPREVLIAAEIDKKCTHFPTEEEMQAYIDSEQSNNNAVDEIAANGGVVPPPASFSAATLQPPVQQPMPQPVQAPVQQPVPQPIPQPVQQPVQQPTWTAPQPAVDVVQAPVTQPVNTPSVTAGLTPQEQAEYAELQAKAAKNPASLSIDDFNRLSSLIQKVK